MPRVRPLPDDHVRRLRSAAQLLHRPRRLRADDVVRRLTGVQAQVLHAGGLALRARTEGLTAASVARARLEDRSIVLTWAMRGTLHLVTAEDYPWLVPLVVEPMMANAFRRLKQEGVPPDQPAEAIRLIERVLEREGPLTRPEIADRLRRRGIRTEGQAIAYLVWLAAAKGVIVYGPDRGGDRRLVLVRDWIGEPKTSERQSSLAELAVRYLRAHGPAEPPDLAAWSGIRVSDARRGWKAVEARLEEVRTVRGTLWALRSQKEMAPSGLVRLLPSFDEYLLGWKERDLVASTDHWRSVNRGGGWIHPVVVADGRAVAMWKAGSRSNPLRLEVIPFFKLAPAVRRAIASEATDVGRFLGRTIDLTIANAPGNERMVT